MRVVEADGPVSFGGDHRGGRPAQEHDLAAARRARAARAWWSATATARCGPGSVLTRYARRTSATDQLVATARPFLQALGREHRRDRQPRGARRRARSSRSTRSTAAYLLGATNWVGLRRAVPLLRPRQGVPRPPRRRAARRAALEQRTDRTITTRDALAADLRAVRRRGYAVADEELEPGLVAIAAPVRDAAGHVVAALSVSGPIVRLTAERITPRSPRLLVRAAAGLSRRTRPRQPTPPTDQPRTRAAGRRSMTPRRDPQGAVRRRRSSATRPRCSR